MAIDLVTSSTVSCLMQTAFTSGLGEDASLSSYSIVFACLLAKYRLRYLVVIPVAYLPIVNG